MKELIVLGAGIAGISAAYHGQKIGIKCSVYEAAQQYGGLLDFFTIDGFRFDKAVHLSFTKDAYVRSIFEQTEYIMHQPKPYNYEDGKWLKHPIQNNLFPLSVQDKIQAIESFVARPNVKQTNDYQAWLVQQYGSYIATRFPIKYTKKYWTVAAERLSTEWIGNRLYRPTLNEVLHGAMTEKTPNTYYAQEMYYPCKGGYKAFIEPLAKECDIQTNKKAILIEPDFKYVQFDSGEQIYYDQLVSTIPLPELVRIIKNVPAEILQLANTLWATSVALVSIGFHRPDLPKHLWFYIYDEDILASRVYSPSIKSLDNVPVECSSLQFEIYFSKYKPLLMQQENLVEYVVESLETMHLAEKEDIIVTDCRILPYGNVAFEKGMVNKRKLILDYLSTLGIYVAGRFGEWDYLWSDQSLLSGKRVVEQLNLK